jgi:phospholipase C
VINDPFFPAANGTFLNQQYLVAARASIGTAAGSPTDLAQHAVVDANGFPNQTYPPQHPDTEVKDAQLTQACETPTTKPGRGPRWLRGQTPPTEKPTLRHPRPDPADRRRPESEHRRPADSRKHQLELVLRRAGRRCRHPGRCSIPPSAAELLGETAPGPWDVTTHRTITTFIDDEENGTPSTASFVKPHGAEYKHPCYASKPRQ